MGWWLRKLIGDDAGNATIFMALSSLVLIGAAGAATDTIQWTLLKRKLQRQADSAAIAGALARMSGGSMTTAATAAINRYTSITLQGSPIIETPTSGAYAGNARAVRVAVTANAALPFSQMFLGSGATMSASSTAAAIGHGDYCVLALETADATGIKASGNSTTTLGCGMATNAQGAKAIEITGSSAVNVTSLMAMGAISVNGNGSVSPGAVQVPYAAAQSDPFAGLPDPVVPSGCNTRLRVNPSDTVTIPNPTGIACYAEMDLKGTVTFSPGVYILDGGDLKLNATANVSGNGVVFILTSSNIVSNPSSVANLSVNGGARLNITAPATGTYAGIFLYQDRRAADDSGSNDVSGNSTSFMQGAIYFPAQRIKFTGNSGMNTDCLQIVARRVEFTGNNEVTNSCPTNSGAGSFNGYQVRLVD